MCSLNVHHLTSTDWALHPRTPLFGAHGFRVAPNEPRSNEGRIVLFLSSDRGSLMPRVLHAKPSASRDDYGRDDAVHANGIRCFCTRRIKALSTCSLGDSS
ncbi:hypothetical protein EVAR_33100_1 [Eumeta japonica]|uniref:Uncharacterized protein n=1 Tax=Eumeta variegata TaxID=151549 RepID=A0A4C1YCN3_EUMVA|nr:hypothetical protein EVAR_33100_1 [Eumeta japonica]